MRIGIASGDYLRADFASDKKEHWGGAGWARIGQYVTHFEAAGHEVIKGILWTERGHASLFVEDADHFKMECDVILLQRLMHQGLGDSIKMARKAGQVIIQDIDDWYWGLDQRNAAFYASHPKYTTETVSNYSAAIAASDITVFSTPFLADKLKHIAPNQLVIPNYIDSSLFEVREQQKEPTLGWVGSTAHRLGDVETLAGILNQLRNDYAFHHSGHNDSAPWFADLAGLLPELVSTTPMSMMDGYPELLKGFDVGVVPLRMCNFNQAKTAQKGLDYASAGIPFVAAPTNSYKYLYQQWGGEGFFIAEKPKDWIKYLKRLRPLEVRQDMQAILLDKIQAHQVEFGAQKWLELLEGVVSSK